MRTLTLVAAAAVGTIALAACNRSQPADGTTNVTIEETAVPPSEAMDNMANAADNMANAADNMANVTEQGSTDHGSTDHGSTDHGSTDH